MRIVTPLDAHATTRQWGLARYVVRGLTVDDLEPVLTQLRAVTGPDPRG